MRIHQFSFKTWDINQITNGFQYAKTFLSNFLQSLFTKPFYHQSFLLYGNLEKQLPVQAAYHSVG